MFTDGPAAAGVRELLLVVGLAAVGLLMVVVVTLGPYVAAKVGTEGQGAQVGVTEVLH